MSAAVPIDAACKAASIAYSLHARGDVRIDGVPFDLHRYPYLVDLYDRDVPVTTILKGAQMGFTIEEILRLIVVMQTRSTRGVGYWFPTIDEVVDFAKARWDRIARDNPDLFPSPGKTDSASLKQIGDGYIYFRGAGARGKVARDASTSKQKSMPLDEVVLDEADEMDAARVDAIEKRLDGSLNPKLTRLSTPTLPEYGVDLSFAESDQRAWFWTCPKCNGHTCLEITYPDCIAEVEGGEYVYLCRKCRDPLERRVGQWVAKHPDRSKQHQGFHASQLCSPTKTASAIMDSHAKAERSGRRREYENQVLARPYAELEDKLTDQLLNACLGTEPRQPRGDGPAFMGVDPGSRKLHYVVGQRLSEIDWEVLNWGYAETFEGISDIAKKFNVAAGVMDQGAEKHGVRAFVKDHGGWFGCFYGRDQKGSYTWNHREHIVTVDRTESLDASHAMITGKRVTFPRVDEVYQDVVAPQMKNLARMKHEDKETGQVVYRWVVTGATKNDHIRHAFNYAGIAIEQAPLAGRVSRARRSSRPRVLTPPSAMSA